MDFLFCFLDIFGFCFLVKVKEVFRDFVIIIWEIFIIDGGVFVNNYIIEKREVVMRVFKIVIIKCSKIFYRIFGFVEGCMYYFRVLLENIYGIGEFCEIFDVVLVFEVFLVFIKLEVVDVIKLIVSFVWEKLFYDGGSRFIGYVFEVCKVGIERWMKVVILKFIVLEYIVIFLNEGE